MAINLRIFVAAAALLAGGAPARAESDCILDRCADRQPSQSLPSAVAPANFDFYVLAFSWSPSFCERSHRSGGEQCAPGADRGFVLHGLWPQYEHGFPQDCGFGAPPSRLALARARGVYPEEGLARYEWRKHGACTGLSPGDYFDSAARAKGMVATPQELASVAQDKTLGASEIERAFLAANPRLRPGMLSVVCGGGALQEVRICLSKDLRDFRPCPELARRSCRDRAVRIPAPR
ncbi:MAG: ribonuclease T2 [Methylocystis sp.]